MSRRGRDVFNYVSIAVSLALLGLTGLMLLAEPSPAERDRCEQVAP